MRVPVTALALLALVAGCDEGNEASTSSVRATRATSCDTGERPDYFVPGPDPDEPLAIIGCARLGESGKSVEFSAHAERIGREAHLCVNPAYGGRDRLGIYIPSICPFNPVPKGVRVLEDRIPTQAVRGYGLVIWGTVAASTRRLVARHNSGTTAAATFSVNGHLAREVGARRSFSVFVVELPREAGCSGVLVRAQQRSGSATERIAPHANRCAVK